MLHLINILVGVAIGIGLLIASRLTSNPHYAWWETIVAVGVLVAAGLLFWGAWRYRSLPGMGPN